MLSKWQIWDFFQANSTGIPEKGGIYSFHFFDSLFSIWLKKSLKKNSFIQGGLTSGLTVLNGLKFTPDWIEDNLLSLGLFGNNDSYYIIQADQMPKASYDLLLSNQLMVDKRVIILNFDKETPQKKKLDSADHIQGFKIEAPKFWDFNKLLDFMADMMEVRISFETKNFILTSIAHEPLEFFNALSILSVNFPDVTEVTLLQAQSVLSISRFDQFELASLFSRKKFSDFYEKVLLIEDDFDTLRQLFNFMQSHMIKIADPSFIEKKKRATKYDNEIKQCSKLWNQAGLDKVIRGFGRLELLAKQKSPDLLLSLKQSTLKSYGIPN